MKKVARRTRHSMCSRSHFIKNDIFCVVHTNDKFSAKKVCALDIVLYFKHKTHKKSGFHDFFVRTKKYQDIRVKTLEFCNFCSYVPNYISG
jgi:hypothetical protein